MWSNERWVVSEAGMKLPVTLILTPRAHHDLADLPDDVRRANAGFVGRALVERLGGSGPAWAA